MHASTIAETTAAGFLRSFSQGDRGSVIKAYPAIEKPVQNVDCQIE